MSQIYLERRKAERMVQELSDALANIGPASPVGPERYATGEPISSADMDECPGVASNASFMENVNRTRERQERPLLTQDEATALRETIRAENAPMDFSGMDRLDDLLMCDCGRGPIPQGNGAPDCCASCSRDAMQERLEAFVSAGYKLLEVWLEECCDHEQYGKIFDRSFDEVLAQLPLIVLPSMDSRPCRYCGTQVAFQEACRVCGR